MWDIILWITNKGSNLFGIAYGPHSIIGPDPDHQFVPSSSSHLVEELQALLPSLRVEDTWFQQCTVSNWSGGCIKLHVIASICNKSMKSVHSRFYFFQQWLTNEVLLITVTVQKWCLIALLCYEPSSTAVVLEPKLTLYVSTRVNCSCVIFCTELFIPLQRPTRVWSVSVELLSMWTQSAPSASFWIIPQMLISSKEHWSSRVCVFAKKEEEE